MIHIKNYTASVERKRIEAEEEELRIITGYIERLETGESLPETDKFDIENIEKQQAVYIENASSAAGRERLEADEEQLRIVAAYIEDLKKEESRTEDVIYYSDPGTDDEDVEYSSGEEDNF